MVTMAYLSEVFRKYGVTKAWRYNIESDKVHLAVQGYSMDLAVVSAELKPKGINIKSFDELLEDRPRSFISIYTSYP